MILNKLVRDRIPEIIAAEGKNVCCRVLRGDELKKALKAKVIEEAQEIANAETLEQISEEIADLLEVLRALRLAYGIDETDLQNIQMRKLVLKGGFSYGYFLESVEVRDANK